jgi:hypothetical protein
MSALDVDIVCGCRQMLSSKIGYVICFYDVICSDCSDSLGLLPPKQLPQPLLNCHCPAQPFFLCPLSHFFRSLDIKYQGASLRFLRSVIECQAVSPL